MVPSRSLPTSSPVLWCSLTSLAAGCGARWQRACRRWDTVCLGMQVTEHSRLLLVSSTHTTGLGHIAVCFERRWVL